jgi:hypothetical protein
MSIESNATKIKVMMAERNLRPSDIADKVKKSRQFISGLINPQQIRKRQEELIEQLERIEKV